MTVHPIFDTPSGDPEPGYSGHSVSCHCWSCLGAPEEHPGTWLVDQTIRICEEWYDEVVQGDSPSSLYGKLMTLGSVEDTWDYGGTTAWYEEWWVHPAYMDQPKNDDPPGSILEYQYFHVYRLKDPFKQPHRAMVRVCFGRMGDTTLLDIRHPGERTE